MYVWEYFAHMTYHNFPWGSVCNDKNSEYIYLLNILVKQRCNVLQEDVVLKICIKKDERKNM